MVFEEIDARKWGQLILHCTIPVPKTKRKQVQLEAEYGLPHGFRESKRLDLRLAHEMITGKPLTSQQLDIVINAMRTVDEKLQTADRTPEIEEEIIEGQFFQSMVTLDYTRLVRLIPRMRKVASTSQLYYST